METTSDASVSQVQATKRPHSPDGDTLGASAADVPAKRPRLDDSSGSTQEGGSVPVATEGSQAATTNEPVAMTVNEAPAAMIATPQAAASTPAAPVPVSTTAAQAVPMSAQVAATAVPAVSLPIRLQDSVVHSLGRIDQREGYHTQQHIFPIGFTSSFIAPSLAQPSRLCAYVFSINDGADSPQV